MERRLLSRRSLSWIPRRAASALDTLDAAIATVTGWVQTFGSTAQRLRIIESNLTTATTNTAAAKTRITDANVASEQATVTRMKILQQLATAQLTQANVAPQSVLALFKNTSPAEPTAATH